MKHLHPHPQGGVSDKVDLRSGSDSGLGSGSGSVVDKGKTNSFIFVIDFLKVINVCFVWEIILFNLFVNIDLFW